ncbi:amino acid ABC transporter permease [Breoghania sp. L-A4]|uniref:amino acid ABC transporter permease n=1 Tax=Breoghania sp. L-A4 TaxID=2304600 RepID=UPI000E35F5B4|nr:amino acid ABC transporter permease [Breoghania sp. L-A4]AXS40922.1 amino acid ABC transporter permease [Breoghania sp. L-A4]
MSTQPLAYVRTDDAPVLPPPPGEIGIRGWLWKYLFSSMSNFSTPATSVISVLMMIATVSISYFLLSQIWTVVNFAFVNATWSDPEGLKREACMPNPGACWPYVMANWKVFIYGRYPDPEVWRVNTVYGLGALGIAWMMIEGMPKRPLVALLMLTVFPVVAFVLLTGGHIEIGLGFWIFWLTMTVVLLGLWAAAKAGVGGEALEAFSGFFMVVGGFFAGFAVALAAMSYDFGLVHIETALWGGLLVTLVVAVTGIVASLPLGIMLALGRRSTLPIIKILSIIFIEFWRGVPLITVLFMSSVMLPLFLPEGTDFDKLLRALIGVALFSSAYMAEVVRGGLQAIPKGQYEGAMAMGLRFWPMMGLIILPQALTLVIPGIVNTFIGLFKDTTLVLIIGLFDLLGQINLTFSDSSWSTPVQSQTGYLVAASIFWIFCFSMSRYSIYMEKRLHRGHER